MSLNSDENWNLYETDVLWNNFFKPKQPWSMRSQGVRVRTVGEVVDRKLSPGILSGRPEFMSHRKT